jgi:DUF2934 family protein
MGQPAQVLCFSKMEAVMEEREQRIREIAYFLWLEEGSPEGGQERHWGAAEALYDSVDRKMIEGEPPGDPLEGDAPDEARKTGSAKEPSTPVGRGAMSAGRAA